MKTDSPSREALYWMRVARAFRNGPRVHARQPHAPAVALCQSKAKRPRLVRDGDAVTCKHCLSRLQKGDTAQADLFGGGE